MADHLFLKRRRGPGSSALFLLTGLAALALVGMALVMQHAFGREPCAWCVLQRLCYLMLAAGCLLAAAPSASGGLRRWSGALWALGFSVSGIVAALYQHLVAAASGACGISAADRLIMKSSLHQIAPWLFMPNAPCNEADAPLLGIPFSLWSATAFALASVIIVVALRRHLFESRP